MPEMKRQALGSPGAPHWSRALGLSDSDGGCVHLAFHRQAHFPNMCLKTQPLNSEAKQNHDVAEGVKVFESNGGYEEEPCVHTLLSVMLFWTFVSPESICWFGSQCFSERVVRLR